MIKKVVFLSLVLAGCGGIVNYTPDGGEGGSGALGGGGAGPGPGPGPGPNNTTTNAQSMDVVTTGPSNTCDVFCQQYSQCFDVQCLESCDSVYVPGCESQAEAFLQCLIQVNQPDCGFELCPSQELAYSECLNASSCVTDNCDPNAGPEGSCTCEGQCYGTAIAQYCLPTFTGGDTSSVGASGGPPPPQELLCNCYLGGSYVGDCFGDSSVCSIEEGCCQQYFEGLE